jgi:hypothetical protein
VIRRPTASLPRLGNVVDLAFIVLWAWTRTIGIPPIGGHAGEIEPVGMVDVVAKLVEASVVALLGFALGQTPAGHRPSREQARSQTSRDAAALV